MRSSCEQCGLEYDKNGESVAFMYLTTAVLTGVMFIVLITVPPRNLGAYRVGFIGTALLLYLASMPWRKGLAIALLYVQGR